MPHRGASSSSGRTAASKSELAPLLQRKPSNAAHQHAPITLRFALSFGGLGLLCFYTVVFLGLGSYRGDDIITQAELHAEVSPRLFECQAAAFGAILLLNIINLMNQQTATQRNCHVLMLYVHLVAFSTDLLLASGLSPIIRAPNGRVLIPLRYIQWCHSTPSILLVLSTLGELSARELSVTIFFDILMMLTGLLACWTSGAWAVVNTAVSFVSFVPVLYYMRTMTQTAIRESKDAGTVRILRFLEALMLVVWSAFPLVWLPAYLGLVSSQTEQILWLACDYMSKVAFSSHLWHNNFMSTAQRREAALAAWEEANRTMTIEKLRQLVASKERMVRTMTHELKTPINGIIALASEMITNGRLQSSEECMASVVRSSGHCLLNIIDSSRDLHGKGGRSVQRKCLNLHTVLNDVEAIVRPLVHEDVKLVNCITKSFPPVVTDETKLTQILLNLLGFSTRQTQKGNINISATVSHNQARVNVSDTGAGLHPDKVNALTKWLKTNEDGLEVLGSGGLSLFLVKQHLEACGSRLEVASELGRGTTFSFTLPLLDDSLLHEDVMVGRPGRATEEDVATWNLDLVPVVGSAVTRSNSSALVAAVDMHVLMPAAGKGSAFPFRPSHRHRHNGVVQVMCVVDDMINQMVAEAMLRSQGWKVVRALDGNKAYDLIRQEADVLPDILLIDVTVPGMTGHELISKFRETFPSAVLPIIMISARATEGSIVAGLKNGADDYVVKPFKRAELIARIRAQLRARDSLHQQQARESEWFLRHNLLPESIRQRLQEGDTVIAEQHPRATVMWLSVVDFAHLAQRYAPMDLVVMINHFHAAVDRLCVEEQVLGVDFTGNTHVAMAGHDNNPQHIAKMLVVAQKAIAIAAGIKCPDGTPLKVSVGLHTGAVTSGLVGVRAVKYTIMGEAVDAARCLAGNGWPYCVHLSSAVYNHMPMADQSRCTPWAADVNSGGTRGASEPSLGSLQAEVGMTFVLNVRGDPMAPVLERAAYLNRHAAPLTDERQLLLPPSPAHGALAAPGAGAAAGDISTGDALLVSQQLRAVMEQTASLQSELRTIVAQQADSQAQLQEWRQVAAELRAALPAGGCPDAAAHDAVASAVVQQQIDALVASAEQPPEEAAPP